MRSCIIIKKFFLIVAVLLSCTVFANQGLDRLFQDAMLASKKSGESVKISDQAMLNVPNGHLFIPREKAVIISEAMGNFHNELLQGIVMPSSSLNQGWMVYISYENSGYVTDEDQESLDSDYLFQTIKDSTQNDNKIRKEKGLGDLTIEKWLEKPTYDKKHHQLVWSLLAKENDIESGRQFPIVNYKASMLGREGMFSFILVTDESQIENNKRHIKKVLENITYNEGKRYEDFLPGTDKVAGYGLAALVTGVAAKKMGLFAILGVFLAKAGKFLLLIPVLLANKIKKMFSKEK